MSSFFENVSLPTIYAISDKSTLGRTATDDKTSSHGIGNPLWLLGVDVPAGQKLFFKMFKILKKIVSVHLHILCSLTKSCKKKIFFVAYVKRQIFMVQNYYLCNIFFIFFIQATKNVFLHQNFGGWT
jgi:hypothetical protein